MDCRRPSSEKQMNSVQNICIETCQRKHKQVRGVLAVFAFAKLALNFIKQVQCNS